MVLREYAKIRILTLWRENNGPTLTVKILTMHPRTSTETTQSSHIQTTRAAMKFVNFTQCEQDDVHTMCMNSARPELTNINITNNETI